MEINPVAYIHTDFKEKFGIPRQSGRVKSLLGYVVFEPKYRNPDAVRGIEDFSHLWLLFEFHKAKREKESLTVRPPRLGGNERVGIFASRSPYRPNPIGLSCVKLEKIEHTEKYGDILVVSGIDILDKTPIYDIKPYLPYSDAITDAKGSYGEEMKNHSLNIEFKEELLNLIPKEKQEALISCLKDDPRPAYHTDIRKYSMAFGEFDVHFIVEGNNLKVLDVDEKMKGEVYELY